MRSKAYCINITPVAWKRAARNGNRMYDAQVRDKVAYGLYLGQQHNDEPLFEKPISVALTFFMPIPSSLKNKKLPHYQGQTPDIDNLCKFILDTFKDILITDDRIICSLFAEKVYDEKPRTELIITEVE